jgi:SAM-dependent methyltransferase
LRSTQERQRAIAAILRNSDVEQMRLAEVGCGVGHNLLELLRFGFRPEHLTGIELLEDRANAARSLLPSGLEIISGDATIAPIQEASQDIVYQSVVFSSILDDDLQAALASRMWQWVKPGGAVLWYDFIYDNPRNREVRAVSPQRVRELFPSGSMSMRRVTLAPPVARAVCRVAPSWYGAFSAIPLLRSHVLCWIEKP